MKFENLIRIMLNEVINGKCTEEQYFEVLIMILKGGLI
jgi:hypothetical protein